MECGVRARNERRHRFRGCGEHFALPVSFCHLESGIGGYAKTDPSPVLLVLSLPQKNRPVPINNRFRATSSGNSSVVSPAWGEMCITGGVAQRNLRSATPPQQSPAWGEIIGLPDAGGVYSVAISRRARGGTARESCTNRSEVK
jgi:hypothetical protein